jgi:hydroxymethylbilane synthase
LQQGLQSELVPVKSPADRDLSRPLNQFGGTGIFTKVLDDALLNGEVDIAVHSMKDYPTQAPAGLCIVAVLERASATDILVHKGDLSFLEKELGLVATGSIRRVAQWKNRYPTHDTIGLRGNVQTRLQKLADNPWNGAIFAKAGLERIDLLPAHYVALDWMISAPAQGAIAVGCRSIDKDLIQILRNINHAETELLVGIERDFLRMVEGGCSAPIGAHAVLNHDEVSLKAGIFDLDGSQKILVQKSATVQASKNLGVLAAEEVLNKGGRELMQKIKNA